MQIFPTVPPSVTPLYVENSRDLNRSIYSFVSSPIEQVFNNDSNLNNRYSFQYRSKLKVIDSTMYEPVVMTSVISNSPLDSRGFDRSHSFEDSRTFSFKNDVGFQAPAKPPRRSNKCYKNIVLPNTCNNKAGNTNTMRNGNGDTTTIDVDHINLENNYKKFADATVQTSHLIPYRLRFWPRLACDVKVCPSEKNCTKLRLQCCCRVLSQWILSQFGLSLVVVTWALLGAFAFFKTEGPRELKQAHALADIQTELSIDLATDLKKTVDHASAWPETIHKYFEKHEGLLLEAVSAGFGEGGGGSIWTYPGCILFAVSLLTTLGFGAPVPRTTLGRGAAVLFSAVGIPLHFLLVLNMGNLAAIKLQKLANSNDQQPNTTSAKPLWLKYFPFLVIGTYYLLGVVLFGFVRQRSVPDSLMFPLDFTAAGGVGSVTGYVRILYALYLELAVTLATTVVSLIQASASRGFVDLGLRLGLLTNT